MNCSFLRNVIPFIPAFAMFGAGIYSGSLPLILIGAGFFGIHYELYKIKTKIENSGPWY